MSDCCSSANPHGAHVLTDDKPHWYRTSGNAIVLNAPEIPATAQRYQMVFDAWSGNCCLTRLPEEEA